MNPLHVNFSVQPNPGWRKKPDSTCDVYIVMARDGSGPMYVKVGMSSHPESRLVSIQTACPLPLLRAMAFTCRSTALARAAEGAMHLHLREYSTVGEWFRFEWGEESKGVLETAMNDLIEQVDGRNLRQIDLSTVSRSVLERRREAEQARARQLAAAIEKHRVAVELRAPHKRP
ncbi:GIY-YIG nuclease family protein [Stenotrophomonas sp. PSU-St15]